MQRAASSPSTPSNAPPPSKRQRLTSGAHDSTPSTPSMPVDTFASSVAAAVAAEEAKNAAAVERAAAAAGETRWVLSIQDDPSLRQAGALNIVQAGFGEIDALAHDGSAFVPGRMKFGRGPPQPVTGASKEDDENDDSSDEDDSSDPEEDPAEKLIRQERAAQARADRQAKRKADAAEMEALAKKRRTKEVNLNRLSSISGGGSTESRTPTKNMDDVECYECGQKGHMRSECPNPKKRKPDKRGGGGGDFLKKVNGITGRSNR